MIAVKRLGQIHVPARHAPLCRGHLIQCYWERQSGGKTREKTRGKEASRSGRLSGQGNDKSLSKAVPNPSKLHRVQIVLL